MTPLVEPRHSLVNPFGTILLEARRLRSAGVVIVSELETALGANLIRGTTKLQLIRRLQDEILGRWPKLIRSSGESWVIADRASEHGHCFVRSVTRSNEPSGG